VIGFIGLLSNFGAAGWPENSKPGAGWGEPVPHQAPGEALVTACRVLKVGTFPARDQGDLLAGLHGPAPLAWVRRGDGLIGWGEAVTIIIPAGPDRFAVAERMLGALFDAAETEDHVGLPGCGPVAFGSFTFDPARGGSVRSPARWPAGGTVPHGLPPSPRPIRALPHARSFRPCPQPGLAGARTA